MFNFARKFFTDFVKELLIYILVSIFATFMTSLAMKFVDYVEDKRWESKRMSAKTHTNENSDTQSEE